MAGSKKFWLGMALGAVAGGAISLLDRGTRAAVRQDFQKASGNIAYIAKHPNEFIEDVKDTVYKVKHTIEQVSDDVAFITEKVEEIRDVPPQVAEIVEDAKKVINRMGKPEGEASGS
jgi:gas vesicle protein